MTLGEESRRRDRHLVDGFLCLGQHDLDFAITGRVGHPRRGAVLGAATRSRACRQNGRGEKLLEVKEVVALLAVGSSLEKREQSAP